MKKSILATMGGVCFGIILMLGVFSILNMKPVNEEVLARNEESTASEEVQEVILEEAIVTEDTEWTELDDTEVVKETYTKTESLDCPYYIRVNRQANCVTVYTKDANGEYTVPVKAMACSVGLTGETPLGVSKISARYPWRLLFGNTYGQYSVRFNGHILFHSVPYLAPSNDTLKEGQFNLLGQPASQGCVRLCVADAKWIYDNCCNGTMVEVYDSPDPGPLGKPTMSQISPYSPYRGWDPTDPNPANPWLYGTVTISGVKDITIDAGEDLDLLKDVWATDVDGLSIAVTASGDVDENTPGTYEVTYTATGVLGTIAVETATVTVNGVENTETETEEQPTETEEGPVEEQPTEEPTEEQPTQEPTEEQPTESENQSTEIEEQPTEDIPAEQTTEMSSTEIPGIEETTRTETMPISSEDTEMP